VADESDLSFRGEVLTTDGRNFWTVSRDIACQDPGGEAARARAYAAGRDAAREIREVAGAKLPRF
jgi:hypothetical protein